MVLRSPFPFTGSTGATAGKGMVAVVAAANAVGVLLGPSACRSPSADLAAAATSSSAPTDFAPRNGPYLVGELARGADYVMSVDTVRECPDVGQSPPKRGFVRLGLELALEGKSAREVPSNPFYATLRDLSGEAYPGTLAGCDPVLPAIRLTSGVKARGHVSFDVPRAAAAFELRYAPPVIGQGVEELRFTIRR